MDSDFGVQQHCIYQTQCQCVHRKVIFVLVLQTQSKVPPQVCPRKVCTPRREHIWDGCSLLSKAAQKSTKQHCWCHFTPDAFTKAAGRAGGQGQAQLDASHSLPSNLTCPTCEAFAERQSANQSPSAIKDGKIPSFTQLCLFSSLFLSLADRVGREKERMGREAPERGKLPPDQAIEVRKEREGENRG